MMTKNFYIAAFVVSMLAFSSCKIGKRYARPELNLPDRIEAYTDTTDTASVENIPWESLYADETLKDLIKKALDNNKDMKIAAAKALAGLISDEELNADYIIPAAFDPRVKDAVANAVKQAAYDSGVARI